MIWVGVLLGSVLSSPEAVQGVAFVVIFPITFIASTFVPIDTLPEPLRTIAEWNPVSSLAERAAHALRQPQRQRAARRTVVAPAPDRLQPDLGHRDRR